jgi:hypothetical protein
MSRILFRVANKEGGFKHSGSCLSKIKLREIQNGYFESLGSMKLLFLRA